jgi:hypothetical protein
MSREESIALGKSVCEVLNKHLPLLCRLPYPSIYGDGDDSLANHPEEGVYLEGYLTEARLEEKKNYIMLVFQQRVDPREGDSEENRFVALTASEFASRGPWWDQQRGRLQVSQALASRVHGVCLQEPRVEPRPRRTSSGRH